MYRLIYSSRPFGFDASILSGLLIDSRENNKKNNITGSLLCRADIYLQMLEGPEKNVLSAFNKIKMHDRHLEVEVLLKGETNSRMFSDWAMKDDPVESWMWSHQEVSEGAILESSQEEILNIFKKIASDVN